MQRSLIYLNKSQEIMGDTHSQIRDSSNALNSKQAVLFKKLNDIANLKQM
jgi:hypothetical protein